MKYAIKISGFLLAFLYGCDNPADFNRPGDKLSGYITHVDSNLYLNGGFYSVSIYNADSVNPFNRVPVRTDSLTLTKRDALYESRYDMDDVPSGHMLIASTWSRYPRVQNEIPIVLGTYGCDTSASCNSHTMVPYPNYEGHFRNLTSWTDLNRRLY